MLSRNLMGRNFHAVLETEHTDYQLGEDKKDKRIEYLSKEASLHDEGVVSELPVLDAVAI